MAIGYSKNIKNCATCTYWMGQRSSEQSGQRVVVLSNMEKGKCGIPKGASRGLQKSASTSCRDWMKWSLLK